MPALTISNIQITETNVDSLTNVTLLKPVIKVNLVLKDQYKKGIFGNANAGVGSSNRYLANTGLYTYKNNEQISLALNSNNLNTNCSATTPLPDGIYTIKYTVYPAATYWVQKEFMRVSQIKCTYERVFLAIDLHCSCNGAYYGGLKDELRNVKLLIEGSISAANDCNIKDAVSMYNKASSILAKLSKCQCNC